MIKQQKRYLIYQITNLINGKIYIGKHITTNIEDEYFGSGKLIRAAIKKYGIENFQFTILFELQNEEEMNLLEEYVVTQEFCDREDTYNINVGGTGSWNYVNKTYDSNKCIENGKRWNKWIQNHPEKSFKYKLEHMSEDEYNQHSLKISNSLKNTWKKQGHNWLGKHHSEKTIQKMKTTNALYHPHSNVHNHMFGKSWYYNPQTNESKSFINGKQPKGWIKGRKINSFNFRKKISNVVKGRIWITHNEIIDLHKQIDKNQAKILVDSGKWHYGRK